MTPAEAHPKAAPELPLHHVERAVSFSEPSALVVGGWALRTQDVEALEIVATGDGFRTYEPTRIVWFERADVAEAYGRSEREAGFHAVVELPTDALPGPIYVCFRLRTGERLIGSVLRPEPFGEEVLPALRGAFAAHRALALPSLFESRPLPIALLRATAASSELFRDSASICVEQVVQLHRHRYFITGWCHADEGFSDLLLVDDAGGVLADLTRDATFFARPDVSKAVADRPGALGDLGFAITVVSDEGRFPQLFVGRTPSGEVFGVELSPKDVSEFEEPALHVIHAVPRDIERERELMERHLGRALLALRHEARAPDVGVRERRFGAAVEAPEGTIIVPTSGSRDWLRYQLASLAGDADLDRWELLYVVRDPELARPFIVTAEDVHEHFGAHLRVITSPAPLDRSEALRLGLGAASGKRLLLLGERVLAREPGWLSALVAEKDAAADVAAVGPVLVSDAGAIAQGPTLAARSPYREDWVVDRCELLGVPESVAVFEGPVSVTSLSTDCLLTDRALFEAVGGPARAYFQRRFEDRDLGRRLRGAARRLVLATDVRLDELSSVSDAVLPASHLRLDHFDSWLLHQPGGEGAPAP